MSISRHKTDSKVTPLRDVEARQRKGSGTPHVYNGLREEILDLSIRPGTMLDENEISVRYGVSRSPVREAIIRLAAEGLVDMLRNRGAMVAQFDIEELPGYFDALKIVYRLTARGAALHASAEDVRSLEEIQAQLNEPVRSSDHIKMIAMNQMFHQKLAAIAGNHWVMQWQKQLLDHGQRVLRMHAKHFDGLVPEHEFDWHRRIIDAVRKGDPDAADAAGAADSELIRNQMINFIMRGRVGDTPLG